MNIKSSIELIKIIFKNTYNPFQILLYRAGLIKNINIKTKKYGYYKIKPEFDNRFIFNLIYSYIINIPSNVSPSEEDINEFKNFINSVLNKEEYVTIDGLNFVNNNTVSILGERLTDKYNMELHVKDKIALDLGANILDTGLYYAKNGAKKIYAYEASPLVYDVALNNLSLNPKYKNNIELYNKAISNKDKLTLPIEDEVFSAITSEYNDSKNKKVVEVDTITINDIVDKLEGNVNVLKLDIEGSEFELVDETDFSVFDEIMIEYHTYLTGISRNVILDKLQSQGFNCQVIPLAYHSIDEVGLIYAIKNN